MADRPHEKKPRAEAIYLAEQGEADASMREIIFYGLLLCVTHRGRVKELEEWAKKAVLEEQFVSGAWTPAERWAKDKQFQAPSIFTPLTHAHRRVKWTEPALDSVGLAMQAWRGEGHVSGLTGEKLKHYISKPPMAARVDTKTAPPPRYRSMAVVRVARLLVDHGTKLRKLLNLTEDSEDTKPMHIVLKELAAENATLKAALREEEAGARRLQDAWRKAAGRLKAQNKKATEARRDERTKLAEKHNGFKQEEKQRADKRAEAKKHDELERARRLRNEAHARAREAEAETAKAERKVRKLAKQLNDIEMGEADSSSVEDEEEPAQRLPFELLPRRDENGRWQAEAPEVHALRWAQLEG